MQSSTRKKRSQTSSLMFLAIATKMTRGILLTSAKELIEAARIPLGDRRAQEEALAQNEDFLAALR